VLPLLVNKGSISRRPQLSEISPSSLVKLGMMDTKSLVEKLVNDAMLKHTSKAILPARVSTTVLAEHIGLLPQPLVPKFTNTLPVPKLNLPDTGSSIDNEMDNTRELLKEGSEGYEDITESDTENLSGLHTPEVEGTPSDDDRAQIMLADFAAMKRDNTVTSTTSEPKDLGEFLEEIAPTSKNGTGEHVPAGDSSVASENVMPVKNISPRATLLMSHNIKPDDSVGDTIQ
jgi:hypothetical protein